MIPNTKVWSRFLTDLQIFLSLVYNVNSHMQRSFRLQTNPGLLVYPGQPIIHRDLSWLQFNQRVLAEACNSENPLLERTKFLSISASNLDEFFMIRFASNQRNLSSLKRSKKQNQMAVLEKIQKEILKQTLLFQSQQLEVLARLKQDLEGIEIRMDLGRNIDAHIDGYKLEIFNNIIMPSLLPLEPFDTKGLIRQKNLQLAVIFSQNKVWALIPSSIPLCIYDFNKNLNGHFIFFLEDLLIQFLGSTFNLDEKPLVTRFTRDADVAIDLDEDDSESIPDVVRRTIAGRELRRTVRFQYCGNPTGSLIEKISQSLNLKDDQLFPVQHGLGLGNLWGVLRQIPDPIKKDSRFWCPTIQNPLPKPLSDYQNIIATLSRRDLLLHHPYDSFEVLLQWMKGAATDEKVESIDLSIYRTEGASTLEALQFASKNGKKVRVFIELRARFDELNNLQLAESLSRSGVEVIFGFGKIKMHAKVVLISRKEGNALKYFTHLSTGNYHAVTARQYTDLAIITGNFEIGQDAKSFFDSLTRGKIPTTFKRLVAAPNRLHQRMKDLIVAETNAAKAGKAARIFAKVNALVDDDMIWSLYAASQAGVQVDLVVRGACSLIPRVPGLSERIHVVSIVDRFLEHSRIYFFESSRSLYLSSADWMPRNFFSRLELAFPVLDDRIYRYITEIVIPAYLRDTSRSHELKSTGDWKPRIQRSLKKPEKFRCQFYFEELARKEYRGTPLELDRETPL